MNAKDLLVYCLKDREGYVDGKEFHDSDLSSVAISTKFLDLECADITDAGINDLPDLDKLLCIDLDSSRITDISLEKISTFSNLEEIWIEDTEITDEGLTHLHTLKQLKFISVIDCEISDKAVQLLQSEIPGIKVH